MTIKQLGGVFGRNPTFNNVTIEGTLTFDGDIDINSDLTISGNLYLPDNSKAIFGDGSDLQIYHDSAGGGHSYIKEIGTGNLRIQGADITLQDPEGNGFISMVDSGTGGTVYLKHNGSNVLATSASGIDVTGGLTLANSTAPVLKLSNTSGTIAAGDNLGLIEFYSDDDSGGGNAVKATMSTVQPAASPVSGEMVFKTSESTGSLTERLRVKATGIDVTGEVESDTAHFGTGTGTAQGQADEVVVSGTSSTGLTIHSPDANNATLAFGSATDNDYAFVQGFYNSGSPFLRFSIQNSEKVKVTSTGLDVTGGLTVDGVSTLTSNSSADGIFLNGRSDNIGQFTFRSNDGAISYSQMQSRSTELFIKTLANIPMSFNTNNTKRQLIAANGDISFYNDAAAQGLFWDSSESRLGLGTTTPSSALDVAGSVTADGLTVDGSGNINFLGGTNDAQYIKFGDTDDNDIGNIFYYHGNNNMVFTTNTSEAMRIDASQNLLVGTTTAADQGVTIYGNGANGIYSKTTATSAYWITNDGITSTTGTLFAFYNNATPCGSVTISSTNVTNYNSVSDQRLKENIADADDAGSKIDAIQVRKFDWKAGGEHQDYGFIAQELLEVAPVAVSVPEDPEEMMAVDPAKLVPMMLKEIQSLRARIAQLES